jgi:hypothetical protein
MATTQVSIYLKIHAPMRLRLIVKAASTSGGANQPVANMSSVNLPVQQFSRAFTRDDVLSPPYRTPGSSPLLVSIFSMQRCSYAHSE